ncbi:MAG: tRNA uridine-5-carboxymethylaminomethyl(34) synthesis GTPase MnmE [Spirochaetota bacterium]
MKYDYYDIGEPIAAVATPAGRSALAVVRVSGTNAVDMASRCFARPAALQKAQTHRMVFGQVVFPDTKEEIDQVTAAVYRAPHGYTGEDAVELFCHGSTAGVQKIMEALFQAGFRQARPGEFTLRAFMNGKIDLTQAEAVEEIVSAKTRRAHALALGRLSGKLSSRLQDLKRELVDIISHVEVQLDYAEDEVELETELPVARIERLRNNLQTLSETYSTGKMYAEGVKIALAGPTNSGKSSLFNLFLKEDRSIVSEVHGTTRDYIESWISIQGIPVRLYDTAGFRDSDSSIEAEGIRRSSQVLEQSDLVLFLNGSSQDEAPADPQGDWIYVWNKIDVRADKPPREYFPLSTVTGEGFSRLEQEIAARIRVQAGSDDEQEVMIDSLRQKELVEKAGEYLSGVCSAAAEGMPLDVIAPDLQNALDALGELTGEVTSADILEHIFSGFCVGK